MKTVFRLCVAWLVLSATHLYANEVDQIFEQSVSEPGCAVGYAKDGKIEYVKGFGSANLEHDIPITSETRFHVASVTKQITGTAIGMLILEGKLSLDDNVHQYLPALPDYGTVITLRHMLLHTSGLKSYTKLMKLEGLDYGNSITQQQVLDLIYERKVLNFQPGEKFEYSNTGYFLLARVVEKVTGISFRAYTRKHLFEPLE